MTESGAETELRGSGSVRKGCDPFAQTQRSKLQHRRARINQQINKEMRMRAGAENLFRATTNNKVKENVALELSFVNSNLQLLKEELEELNSSVEVYQNGNESVSVPMIPLGLKETKEVELSMPLKRLNLYKVSLDNCDKKQIKRYDSLTGVPSYQRALAFEKGSILFNIGALYTQIGARQDRTTEEGINYAIDAFQKAAGALNYLKENFFNAPSLDMSTPSLNMLVRLMIAQVQECVFEKVIVAGVKDEFLTQLQCAQEAARVADVYSLVYQTMTQPPVKNYVPFSWTTMVQVKSEYFKAISHYYAAIALCDHIMGPDEEESEQVKALQQLHVTMPEGPSLITVLKDKEERRKLGKAHLKKAIIKHEEAMRIHSLCRILRKMDILQEVLSIVHKRSLKKYSEIDREDDFFDTIEAPEIHPKTQQKPEIKTPNFSKVKVTDIFHRLGPLSVFSAKNRWIPARQAHLKKSEKGFGFTLRGDSPVLIAGVVPDGSADEAGLREGDYLVSVNEQDCKWSKHTDVVQLLKNISTEGVSIGVITLITSEQQNNQADRKSLLGTMSSTSIFSGNDKENSKKIADSTKGSGLLVTWNKKKNTNKDGSTHSLPVIAVTDDGSFY
ncbi:hypothetical protein chiPu_0005917 [Chiloscyllium punctatum]|uniref:Rhophilin-1 n=1 Tax=Chiloscyllium punctatum TaxID=137246 RepID=A0A401SAU0_CHIPU|nr:hypothetical protein [Chiloscyllium punctatum]